jgi:hypothetical protein
LDKKIRKKLGLLIVVELLYSNSSYTFLSLSPSTLHKRRAPPKKKIIIIIKARIINILNIKINMM